MRLSVFTEIDDALDLACGVPVVVRGVVETWQSYVALRAFRDGLIVGEASEDARRLAEQWRRQQWSVSPLATRWNFVELGAIGNQPAGARCDVVGIVYVVNEPVTYTRRSDGTQGIKRAIELCDGAERCVRVTLFLDDGDSPRLQRGAVVALRAAKVDLWLGVATLSASASALALDIDGASAAALREVAAEIVGSDGDGDGDERGDQAADEPPAEIAGSAGDGDGDEPSGLAADGPPACRGGGSNCLTALLVRAIDHATCRRAAHILAIELSTRGCLRCRGCCRERVSGLSCRRHRLRCPRHLSRRRRRHVRRPRHLSCRRRRLRSTGRFPRRVAHRPLGSHHVSPRVARSRASGRPRHLQHCRRRTRRPRRL